MVAISMRDLGIDRHIERLAARAVDLGWCLTQEAATPASVLVSYLTIRLFLGVFRVVPSYL
jgi:hypothetical protein